MFFCFFIVSSSNGPHSYFFASSLSYHNSSKLTFSNIILSIFSFYLHCYCLIVIPDFEYAPYDLLHYIWVIIFQNYSAGQTPICLSKLYCELSFQRFCKINPQQVFSIRQWCIERIHFIKSEFLQASPQCILFHLLMYLIQAIKGM